MLNNIAALIGGAASIAGDYESIATANGTGSSNTITFSSIPSTYKHLQIRGIYNDGGYNLNLRFNSDSGTNYASHKLYGNGSSTFATGAANGTEIDTGMYGGSGTSMSVIVIDILDYANTSKNKTSRHLAGGDFNGSGSVFLSSGLWRSTSAISTIQITTLFANYPTATTFALYGIK